MMPRGISHWNRPSILKNIPKNADPIVKSLFKIMLIERMSMVHLAKKVGIARETIGMWRLHFEPKLSNRQACFNAMGYQLVIRKTELHDGRIVQPTSKHLDKEWKDFIQSMKT